MVKTMSSYGTDIHFFKKIEEDTLRRGKLLIPRSFVSECWEGISNPVLLLLPDGVEWNVTWKKVDGEVWLIHRWKKFVEFYCLDQGHLLMFKYVGQSKFQVVIFNQSGLEIRYPLKEGTLDYKEIVNPFCHSKRAESSLPFSLFKKVRNNSTTETNCNSREDGKTMHAQSQKTKVHAKDFDNAKLQEKGGRGIMHANTSGKSSKSKAIECEENENKSALERAKAFSSENPFFIRQMSATYIRKRLLLIPGKFITEDQRNEEDRVTLWISGERTWRVNFCMNPCNGQGKLTNGWMDFVNDNNLEIGNVCVFELVKNHPGISFKVVIYRDREISKPSMVPDCEDETNGSKQRESGENSEKYSGNNVFDGSELRCKKEVSENHFTLTITPVEFYNKRIPSEFIRNHDIDNIKKVTLQVGTGTWPVELDYYPMYDLCRFGSGWTEFKRECDLKVGDICDFKLIDRKEFVFQVKVTRCID